MTYRQFIWGLSNGAMVFVIAGAFWFGLATWVLSGTRSFFALVVCFVALVVAVLRLRRRAQGFRFADLNHGDERQRAETRRIRVGFRWTTFGQTVLVGLAVFGCTRLGREDLIWPWIGLIVSMHFLPLGWVFHLRAYYATGVVGSIISLVALTEVAGAHRLPFLGIGMGLVMWSTAVYVLLNADRIATQFLQEQ